MSVFSCDHCVLVFGVLLFFVNNTQGTCTLGLPRHQWCSTGMLAVMWAVQTCGSVTVFGSVHDACYPFHYTDPMVPNCTKKVKTIEDYSIKVTYRYVCVRVSVRVRVHACVYAPQHILIRFFYPLLLIVAGRGWLLTCASKSRL